MHVGAGLEVEQTVDAAPEHGESPDASNEDVDVDEAVVTDNATVRVADERQDRPGGDQ